MKALEAKVQKGRTRTAWSWRAVPRATSRPMVAGAGRAEEGSAAITAEGDEVEIAASIEALQTVAHEKVRGNAKSKTAPLKGTRVRHPRLHLLPTKGRARM